MALARLLSMFALSSSALAVADPAATRIGEDPKELLFHAIDQSRWLSFEGIIVRRGSMNDRFLTQVKVVQKAGTSKATVIAPLSMQGVTTVDDGKTLTTYLPDDNKLMIQDSPKKTSWNWRRKKVAAGNYSFKAEGQESVAGRKAFAVVATPRASEMPSRRYWLDAEYPLLLRMELVTSGKPVTMLDTKAIEFRTVPDEALQLSTAASVRKVYHEKPERFGSPEEAVEVVGFRPAMPKPLPFGFVISEPQIIGERGERFVAIRVSDGLASATMYQWDASSKNPIPCRDPRFVREANGVKMRLVGDLPEVVLDRLLETFVREALKGLQPLLGTSFNFSALVSIKSEHSDDESEAYVIFRVSP